MNEILIENISHFGNIDGFLISVTVFYSVGNS